MIVSRHVLGGPGQTSPGGKLTLAGIGMGGQGTEDMLALQKLPEVQVVAVCDVNREGGGYQSWYWSEGNERRTSGREPVRRLMDDLYAKQRPSGQYRGCRAYADYRELLEKEDVDAVMVATPDHTHAVITMAALRRRKHVYCEKPLTYSVDEARQVAEAARKAGVATQCGNQGQAAEAARVTCEIIADGAIGQARIVFTGVAEKPFRSMAAEGVLTGAAAGAAVFDEAAEAVEAELDPPSDLHGTAAYRRHVAGVLVRRTLENAAEAAT